LLLFLLAFFLSFHHWFIELALGFLEERRDQLGTAGIMLGEWLDVTDLDEVFQVEGVLVLQQVTDLFELIQPILRTVHNYVVHDFH